MFLFRFFGALLDRLCVVCGAFVGSQIPSFMNQYTQRLAGHVAELNRFISEMTNNAALSGKSLDAYISKFLSQSDLDFSKHGEFMQTIVSRSDRLSQALNHLQGSTVWNRSYVFLNELQYDVASSSLYTFQPSLTLSLEGLCYTGAGILVGYLLFRTISNIMKTGFGRAFSYLKPNI